MNASVAMISATDKVPINYSDWKKLEYKNEDEGSMVFTFRTYTDGSYPISQGNVSFLHAKLEITDGKFRYAQAFKQEDEYISKY